MAVSVLIRFPIPFERVAQLAEQRPEIMAPIIEAATRHGMLDHVTLLGDGEFMDIDTFPSRDRYLAFKAEATPHIQAYEAALGTSSTESVWETLESERPANGESAPE